MDTNTNDELEKLHSISLKGEGRSSFVLAVTNDRWRYVIRFQKNEDNEIISLGVSKASELCSYIRLTLASLLDSADITCLPSCVTLCASEVIETVGGQLASINICRAEESIVALKMPDYSLLVGWPLTCSQPELCYDDISVELKPKLGLLSKMPYCYNCLVQIHKVISGIQQQPYLYCPMQMYSGSIDRVIYSLQALIAQPHGHFVVRKNGSVVFSKKNLLSPEDLLATLFPDSSDAVLRSSFLHIIGAILLHAVPSCDSKPILIPAEGFYTQLNRHSILGKLLMCQSRDKLGVTDAAKTYAELYCEIESGPKLSASERSRKEEQLRQFLIQRTFSDCSIMITIRNWKSSRCCRSALPSESAAKPCGEVLLPDGRKLLYQITLIDLDQKPAIRIPRYYAQFKATVDYLEKINWAFPLKEPCHVYAQPAS